MPSWRDRSCGRVIACASRRSSSTAAATNTSGQRYDRDLSEILVLQADVALAVAQQIRLALSPGLPALTPRVVHPDAHEAYLKGRYLYAKGNHADSLRAVEYFETALRIDPDFALAYAGLADAYS